MSEHPTVGGPVQSTDRELWRERPDDYYADSIHVTEGGGIGINCGGYVVVMPLRKWHALACPERASSLAPVAPDHSRSVNEMLPHEEMEAIYAVCLRAGMSERSTALDYISSVFYAFKRLTGKRESWAVTVERDGESVVTLSSRDMAGREFIDGDEATIRTAARHLLSFLGDPPLAARDRVAPPSGAQKDACVGYDGPCPKCAQLAPTDRKG